MIATVELILFFAQLNRMPLLARGEALVEGRVVTTRRRGRKDRQWWSRGRR